MPLPIPSSPALPLAVAAAIAAPLIWSIGGVVMRSVATAGPWEQVFWRALGGGGAVAAMLMATRPRAAWSAWRRAGLAGWLSAACIAGTFVVHVLAINATTVANVLLVQTANPLLMPVLAWLFLGERLDRRILVAAVLAVAGLVPIMAGSVGGGRLAGDLLALLCALLGAVNILVVRRHHNLDMTPAIVAATVLTLVAALPMSRPLGVATGDVLALMALGAAQIAIGLWLFLFALRHLPAAPVALLTLLEPVVGPLLVWFFVGEVPPATTLAGGVLVVGALLVCVRATAVARRGDPVPTGSPP